MSQSRLRRTRGLACLVGLAVIAGCSTATNAGDSTSGSSDGAPSGEITIYGWTGNWDLWFKDWAQEFEAETGIAINYISGPGSAMRQRITAERAAGSDIFISTPSDAFTLAQEGMLAEIPWDEIPTADAIDDRFKLPEVSVWGYDMQLPAYNEKFVSPDEVPTSWKDLADPKWEGRLGLYAPTDEGSTRHVMVMMDEYGEDEALDLTAQQYANAKLTFNSPGQAESSLANGDTHVNTISMGSAMVVLQQAGGSIKTVLPEEGAFLMLNSMSIMKDAPNKAAAVEFLKFFLGDKMQDTIMNDLGISVAVDSNVELTNEDLKLGLGGASVDEVLENAYVPDWNEWIQTDQSGESRLGGLMDEIGEIARN